MGPPGPTRGAELQQGRLSARPRKVQLPRFTGERDRNKKAKVARGIFRLLPASPPFLRERKRPGYQTSQVGSLWGRNL